MKLKTKLMPMIGLAAITATAIPFSLTSCHKDDSGLINLLERFKPTIEQHEHFEPESVIEVLTDYLSAVEQNINVFREDMIWSKNNYIQDIILPYRSNSSNRAVRRVIVNSLSEVGLNIKNISMEEREVSLLEVAPLLSFDMEYKVKYDIKYEADGERDVGVITCNIGVTKVPYILTYDSYDIQPASLWYVGPNIEYIYDVGTDFRDWQIIYNLSLKETETYTIQGMEIVTEVNDDYDYTFNYDVVHSEIFQNEEYIPRRVLDSLCEPETHETYKMSLGDGKNQYQAQISDITSLCVFTLAGHSWYMKKVPGVK